MKRNLDILHTNSNHVDFISLVRLLDAELAIIDGDDHAFYSQYNKIDMIRFAVVAYHDRKPIACGAIKHFDKHTMEVKRMYVLPDYRGRGIASVVLRALEKWAFELQCDRCVLERESGNMKQ